MEIGWGNRVEEAKTKNGFSAIDLSWSGKFPRVDALRDAAVEVARLHGHTHILFLDADMKWPTDVLVKMLRHHDQGIVSGLYHLKGGDFAPVAMRDGFTPEGSSVTQYYHDRDYLDAGSDLRQEEVVGMGCTLVPMAVFDAIGPRPYFAYANDDDGWPRVSEDVTFCQKAIKAGFKIWLDPTIKCQHGHLFYVGENWHRACAHGGPTMLMKEAEAISKALDAASV
jgi:GT2 family glycosyltransferase